MKKCLLILFLTSSLLSINAYDVKVDGIYYNLNNDTKEAQVTYGNWFSAGYPLAANEGGEYSGILEIPNKIVSNNIEYIVTSVGEAASYKCHGLTEVIFPNSIKYIGEEAFGACTNLSSISLSEGLEKIDFGAFGSTSINSLNLPNSLSYIGGQAFSYCRNLTSLTIPNSVDSIGPDAFYHCEKLESVVVGDGVKTLNEEIFKECYNLKSVSIPNSVNTISWYTFKNCTSLESINIPSGVYEIGQGVFEGCTSLNNVTIPKNVKIIGNAAFRGCSSLDNLSLHDDIEIVVFLAFDSTPWYEKIPEGLVYIGKAAYEYKGKIKDNTTISLKEGTISITGYSFWDQSGLSAIIIPNSVSIIGSTAFQNCIGLTNLILPKNLIKIEGYAFAGCSNLTSIVVQNDVPIDLSSSVSSGESVFSRIDKENCILYVPDNSIDLYKAAAAWSDFKNIKPITSSKISSINIDNKHSDVFDLNGKLVKKDAMSLDGLPKGIYIQKGKKVQK